MRLLARASARFDVEIVSFEPKEVIENLCCARTQREKSLHALGSWVLHHTRKIAFHLAEVAIPRNVIGKILAAIRLLKPPPRPA